MRDLPALLRAGDAVVVNDTKVIPASLHGRRIGRGAHEPAIAATLTRRLDGSRWNALVKPGKRLAVGDVVRFGSEGRVCFLDQLDATVEAKGEGGEVTLAFAFHGPVLDQALAERGDMPLPPYIAGRRPADEQDRTDYQTLFAREEGSVAAPTAGLHFTDAIVERAAGARHRPAQGNAPCRAGYLPSRQSGRHVRAQDAAGMGQRRRRDGGGAQRGAACRRPHRRRRLDGAAAARKRGGRDGTLAAFSGETALFVTPGYRFRAVDVMLTNFHLPRSTLFMLVCGLQRPGDDAPRLCARDRNGLPVLFLRRRLPAVSCGCRR